MNTKQITAANRWSCENNQACLNCRVVTEEDEVNADELMELREQSQVCLGYAESQQKKTEGQKIKLLYETVFPEDEQIPWDDLIRLVGEMPLDFTAYYDGE